MLHANHKTNAMFLMSCQPLVMCFVSPCQVSPLEGNVSESVCSLKFAQRVRTVEIGPSSSSRRQAENSSTSSSPTHDSVEVHTLLFLSMFFIVFFYFQTSIQAGLACNLFRYFNVSLYISLNKTSSFVFQLQLDSPPVTPVPLPISRASSAGSTLSSTSKSSTRRRSHTQLSTGNSLTHYTRFTSTIHPKTVYAETPAYIKPVI